MTILYQTNHWPFDGVLLHKQVFPYMFLPKLTIIKNAKGDDDDVMISGIVLCSELFVMQLTNLSTYYFMKS